MKQCNVVKVGDSHAPIATWAGDVQEREESRQQRSTISVFVFLLPFDFFRFHSRLFSRDAGFV